MQDKEVGELWLHVISPEARALIRKLVEETTKYDRLCCPHAVHTDCNHEGYALTRFGIPEDMWK